MCTKNQISVADSVIRVAVSVIADADSSVAVAD